MRHTSHLHPESSGNKMWIVYLFLLCVGGGGSGAMETVLDVCICPENDGSLLCSLQRGATRLKTTGCGGNLRTTGPGFVTGMEPGAWDMFALVVLERATISCLDFDGQPIPMVNIDGEVCKNVTSRTTTSSQAPVLTKEPKPRPPANPVYDDDDDDDDNADDDGDAVDHDDTTSTTDGTSTTPVSFPTTTDRMITVAAAMAYRDWIIVIAVGILVISAGTVIVVRIRICRRQRAVPTQVNEVTSTSDQPQRTYVLREVPRSPRRRGVADSYDSVTLFAVDDDEL